MQIIINPKNLEIDDEWQKFRKVRAIIENEEGMFAITYEGGKCIFPGGKCEENESELSAIKRELKEETGINFKVSDFQKVLELITIYDEYYDYRTDSSSKRQTCTTYYYIKTNLNININDISLTEEEKKQNFEIMFVDKDKLKKIIMEDHSQYHNGKYFDIENRIVFENIIEKVI